LKTVAALATPNGYTAHDNADHKVPALTVSTASKPLVGSDTAFPGSLDALRAWRSNRGSYPVAVALRFSLFPTASISTRELSHPDAMK
jgi:hypothetical protein